jgi:hypothetical protein
MYLRRCFVDEGWGVETRAVALNVVGESFLMGSLTPDGDEAGAV